MLTKIVYALLKYKKNVIERRSMTYGDLYSKPIIVFGERHILQKYIDLNKNQLATEDEKDGYVRVYGYATNFLSKDSLGLVLKNAGWKRSSTAFASSDNVYSIKEEYEKADIV